MWIKLCINILKILGCMCQNLFIQMTEPTSLTTLWYLAKAHSQDLYQNVFKLFLDILLPVKETDAQTSKIKNICEVETLSRNVCLCYSVSIIIYSVLMKEALKTSAVKPRFAWEWQFKTLYHTHQCILEREWMTHTLLPCWKHKQSVHDRWSLPTTLLSGTRWVNTLYSLHVFPRIGPNTSVLPTQRVQIRACRMTALL